jgi:hypothetical protein
MLEYIFHREKLHAQQVVYNQSHWWDSCEWVDSTNVSDCAQVIHNLLCSYQCSISYYIGYILYYVDVFSYNNISH